MDKLTYEGYLKDPSLRERLEHEARRARAEAVHGCIVAPLIRVLRGLVLPVKSGQCHPRSPGLRRRAESIS